MGGASKNSFQKPITPTDSNNDINNSESLNQISEEGIESAPKQRRVMFGRGQGSKGRGYRLGDGTGNVDVHVEPIPMERDRDESSDDDMSVEDDVLQHGMRGLGLPPPPGRPHPLARAADRGKFMHSVMLQFTIFKFLCLF